MRHKTVKLTLALGVLFGLVAVCRADSTLIEGKSEILGILASSKYAEGNPVLIFTEDLQDKSLCLLNQIDNIVFYDSSWQDLAIDFSYLERIFVFPASISIKEEGIYELWVDTAQLNPAENDLISLEVTVGSKAIAWDLHGSAKRYSKVGEWQLKKGRYRVQVKSRIPKVDLIKMNINLVLVNKKMGESARQAVWDKISRPDTRLGYICEADKGELYINHGEGKSYNLKLKVSPVINDSRVYWGGKSRIDWKAEDKGYKTGLLDEGEIPPVIINKKVNYVVKNRQRYEKTSILVFNPLNSRLKSSFEFSAASTRKTNLEMYLNDVFLGDLELPPAGSEFKTELVFAPGMNEIMLVSVPAEAKSVSGRISGKSHLMSKINFKGFQLKYLGLVKERNPKSELDNPQFIDHKDYFEIVFHNDNQLILSKDLQVDLEEFPLFNFEIDSARPDKTSVTAVLGVDYTGDNLIDDYIILKDSGEHNIFELAKEKWNEIRKEGSDFSLRKIMFLAVPGVRNSKDGQDLVSIRMKKLSLYNEKALFLSGERNFKDGLRLEGSKAKLSISEKDGVSEVSVKLDADKKAMQGSGPRQVSLTGSESDEIAIFIPLSKNELAHFPFFSCNYELEDPEYQEVALGLLISDLGKNEIIRLTDNEYTKSENEIEVNLKDLSQPTSQIRGLMIFLTGIRAEKSEIVQKERCPLRISKLQLFDKFPYPLKSRAQQDIFLAFFSNTKPLVKIGGRIVHLKDFASGESPRVLNGGILSRKMNLKKGVQSYEKIENGSSSVDWMIIEQAKGKEGKVDNSGGARIIFKKINPAKYLVLVENATKPFWLVFSENFHSQWKLYSQFVSIEVNQPQDFNDIAASYPGLKVKEGRHKVDFLLEDTKFLFESPLGVPHHLINGYANGWYIEPQKLSPSNNFILTIYFLPQSFFYLGLIISTLVFMICLAWLIIISALRKIVRPKAVIKSNLVKNE